MTTPEDLTPDIAPPTPESSVSKTPAIEKPAAKKPSTKKAVPATAKPDAKPKAPAATKATKPTAKKVADPITGELAAETAEAKSAPPASIKSPATKPATKPTAAKTAAQKASPAKAAPTAVKEKKEPAKAVAAKPATAKVAPKKAAVASSPIETGPATPAPAASSNAPLPVAPAVASIAAPTNEPTTPMAEPAPTVERANLNAEKILKRAGKNPENSGFIAKIRQKAPLYWRLTRMDRPIGTLLLLWPTLWSLWIAAKGVPSIQNLVIFVLGVIVMRAAGCVINDFADRKIDGKVQRTKDRPLATGAVSSKEALGLFIALCVTAFVLVLFTDPFTIKLSVGGLVLAFCYPFMKRHTHLPQVVLGAAFAWGIPMAYAAEAGKLPQEVWLIYLAVVLWTVAYDTFYAMVDRDDDLKIGVKSTAILFGEQDRLMTGILQAMTIYALILVGNRFELGTFYYLGLAAAAGLFIYQQWLIRFRARAACFQAFLNNNWVGVAVFAGIAADYALR